MKLLSYLSPSIPLGFYETLVQAWSTELGEAGQVVAEWTRSGPSLDQLRSCQDPFSVQGVDVAAMCAPTYIWAVDQVPPRVCILPLLPLFGGGDSAEYSSLVVVRKESVFHGLDDLDQALWCFNDACSLSGYYSLLDHFQGRACRLSGPSGGHYQSMHWVAEGKADAAAVDSNGWVFLGAEEPELARRLRVVGELGPYPAQPFVVSSEHGSDRRAEIARALRKIACNESLTERLREKYGFHRFVEVSDLHFDGVRALMDRLQVRKAARS